MSNSNSTNNDIADFQFNNDLAMYSEDDWDMVHAIQEKHDNDLLIEQAKKAADEAREKADHAAAELAQLQAAASESHDNILEEGDESDEDDDDSDDEEDQCSSRTSSDNGGVTDCGKPLEKNGALRPRRIVDIEDCYYIVAWAYYCRSGCRHYFSGWSRKFIVSLPPFLWLAFPAMLSHKGGLSLTLQAQYIEVLFEVVQQHDESSTLSVTSFLSVNRIASFGDFWDLEGYNGFVPSERFLTSMLNKAVERDESDANQHTSCLPVDHIAIDDSHKGILHPFEPVRGNARPNQDEVPDNERGGEELAIEMENLEEEGDDFEGFVEVLDEMSVAERETWHDNAAPLRSALYKTRKASF
ncbi:hypothetical protein EV361DRAFT_1014032 [Lentinula raphanica]|nr:hypothetical protein EV361DRAFT_1014032 [Lentinula raphanica]